MNKKDFLEFKLNILNPNYAHIYYNETNILHLVNSYPNNTYHTLSYIKHNTYDIMFIDTFNNNLNELYKGLKNNGLLFIIFNHDLDKDTIKFIKSNFKVILIIESSVGNILLLKKEQYSVDYEIPLTVLPQFDPLNDNSKQIKYLLSKIIVEYDLYIHNSFNQNTKTIL